jgi:hypothetical protein
MKGFRQRVVCGPSFIPLLASSSVRAASQSNLPLTPARAALQSQGLDQILIQKEGQQYPLCILRQRLAFPRSSTITFQFERRHTLLLDDAACRPSQQTFTK